MIRSRSVLAAVALVLGAVVVPLSPGAQAASSAASPATAAVTTGPFTVDINNREDVRDFYNTVHEAANGVPDGWTGNVSTCNPGTVSSDYLAAIQSRINYFRTMAGMPDVTFTDALNAEAQAAALIQSANDSLNHHPPSTGTGSTCWTQLGADGSAASNLAIGNEGPAAIDQLMYDHVNTLPGGGASGHRRDSLDPSITTMGSGSIPATPGFNATEANIVHTTPSATRPAVRTGFVAWPPAGFVPYQIVYPRWSFSLPNGDFTGASVAMQHNGASVPVQIRCVDPNTAQDPLCGQFGEPAISWTPNGLADGAVWPTPTADDPWTVTISNVVVNGVAQAPFTYTVTVIDPKVSDAAHAVSQPPSGPATVSVNTNATYTAPAVQDATGYQWRSSSVSAGDIIDGAENGMANFTANIDPDYTPISTAEASSGASSFHLRGFGGTSTPALQTLTFNSSVLATATSALSFDTMYRGLDDESAQVDVSLDGGANWQPTFAEAPPSTQQDSVFTTRTVSLSQFAGHQILLRFSLNFTGGEYSDCCGEPNGWYIDNVALKNVQNAAASVLSAVGANPSFVLNTAQQGPISIDVRPQFTNASFGSSFGPWSPVLAVNVVGSSGLVTVASSANPAAQNQQVTLTATVNPTDGGGTVSFTDGGTAVAGCQSLALTGGQATCQQTYPAGGTQAIVATYSGDGNFAGSTSATLNQVVNAPVITSGTFAVSPTSNIFTGDPVTLTATVSPTDGGGTVAFTGVDASSGCGAVPLNAAGQAVCTTTFVGPLHPLLDASYSGDANFLGFGIGQGGQLILVTARTATSVVSSANPSGPGGSVTYTATVSPANQAGEIDFTDNGNTIAGPPPQQTCSNLNPDSNGSATCTIIYPTAGAHAIVATFTAFGGLSSYTSSTSPTLNQLVGGTLTSTATTLTSSANPSLTGQQITYTAGVTGGDLGGTVAFADGGITIGGCDAVALTGGHATCAQTYTAVGPHLITAAYNGDATSSASSAVTVNQQVNLSPPPAVPHVAVINLAKGAARVTFTPPAAALKRAAGARHTGARHTGARATAAASTPSPVTGFNVYEGTSAGKESTTPLNASRLLATANGYTITGLTTGKKYYYIVKALNARGGVGPASPEATDTPAASPGVPRSLHATSGNGSARLTWVKPTSAGGGKITGYDVYESTTPGGVNALLANPSPLGPTATSYTPTALLNGVTYYFTVRAFNAVGTSPASTVASVIPATAPAAPIQVAAYRGQASVALRWTAPDNTGGSAITGFNVYKGKTPGGESVTPVNPSPLSAKAVSYTATGLTNGSTYYFKVKAVNLAGASGYSSEVSASAAAISPPSGPASLTAKAGAASAGLTWTQPASTGGSAITGYDVYEATSVGGETNTPVNPSPLASTTRTFSVTGLSNAVGYYFTVKAVNAVGVGAPSNEATATPSAAATLPGAPMSPKATAGAAKVTVTWAAPSWNGGSAITGYNVYKGTTTGGESTTPVNASPLSASTKTLAVVGLISGTQYYFFVRAINAIGTGTASSQVSAKPS